MTTTVSVTRALDLPAERAFDLLVDPRNHPRWIPLTRVAVDGLPLGVGTKVTTLMGPFTKNGVPGLPDRMRLEELQRPDADQPGRAVFTRTGPVLLGGATIEVVAEGPDRATATWSEQVWLAGPLPAGLTGALSAPMQSLVLRLALSRAAHEVRRRVR